MRCPKCKSENLKVNESRDLEAEDAIRRRRECTDCNYRFTTYERVEIPLLCVVKKDGSRESFSREKMASGIYKALQKRPFTKEQIEATVDDIERQVNMCACTEMPSSEIGNMIIEKLKIVDEVGYMRFASVYKSFDNAESFVKEIESIKS
jgi:transcriptional repressor NrdR